MALVSGTGFVEQHRRLHIPLFRARDRRPEIRTFLSSVLWPLISVWACSSVG